MGNIALHFVAMTVHGKIDPTISQQLASRIRAIAKTAHSEEDVRLNVEAALKPVLAGLGISTQASYEQPVTLLQGSGSMDAVYGFGIIEYKKPGIIATQSGHRHRTERHPIQSRRLALVCTTGL